MEKKVYTMEDNVRAIMFDLKKLLSEIGELKQILANPPSKTDDGLF